MTSVPNTPAFASIASVIEADQLACEILRFLIQNEKAMDSAKGIAAWWVRCDEVAVQPSLHRLFACGAITAHTLCSGTTMYRLTADSDLRTWLRQALGHPNTQRESVRQPAAVSESQADAGDA